MIPHTFSREGYIDHSLMGQSLARPMRRKHVIVMIFGDGSCLLGWKAEVSQ